MENEVKHKNRPNQMDNIENSTLGTFGILVQ
jgi:hypothetical protein